MPRVRLQLLLTVLLLAGFQGGYSTLVSAAEVFRTQPLAVENRSPIIMLTALAKPSFMPMKQAYHRHWRSQFEVANYLSETNKGAESFRIDGETWVVSNHFSQQLSKGRFLSVSIPWLRHSKGISDRLIYQFHDVLQLPQNGRQDDHHDQRYWNLSYGSEQLLLARDPQSGFGDITLQLSQWIADDPDQQWLTQFKLPNGDFEQQTGSGNIDAGVAIGFRNPDWLRSRTWLPSEPLSFWYGLGLNYIGHIKELEPLEQHSWVLSARSGVAWRINENWQLLSQLDTHSPFFNSKIRELGWVPLQLSFASEHSVSQQTSLTFAITEDLRPRVTPDVIFTIAINHSY